MPPGNYFGPFPAELAEMIVRELRHEDPATLKSVRLTSQAGYELATLVSDTATICNSVVPFGVIPELVRHIEVDSDTVTPAISTFFSSLNHHIVRTITVRSLTGNAAFLNMVATHCPKAKLSIRVEQRVAPGPTGSGSPQLTVLDLSNSVLFTGTMLLLRDIITSSSNLKIVYMKPHYLLDRRPWGDPLLNFRPNDVLPLIREWHDPPIRLDEWVQRGALCQVEYLQVTSLDQLGGDLRNLRNADGYAFPRLREFVITPENSRALRTATRWAIGPVETLSLNGFPSQKIPVGHIGAFGRTLTTLSIVRRFRARMLARNLSTQDLKRLVKSCPLLESLTMDLIHREALFYYWPVNLLDEICHFQALTKIVFRVEESYSSNKAARVIPPKLHITRKSMELLASFLHTHKQGNSFRVIRVDNARQAEIDELVYLYPSVLATAVPKEDIPKGYQISTCRGEPWCNKIFSPYVQVKVIHVPEPEEVPIPDIWEIRRRYEATGDPSARPNTSERSFLVRLAIRLGRKWAYKHLSKPGILRDQTFMTPGIEQDPQYKWIGPWVDEYFPKTGALGDEFRAYVVREITKWNAKVQLKGQTRPGELLWQKWKREREEATARMRAEEQKRRLQKAIRAAKEAETKDGDAMDTDSELSEVDTLVDVDIEQEIDAAMQNLQQE